MCELLNVVLFFYCNTETAFCCFSLCKLELNLSPAVTSPHSSGELLRSVPAVGLTTSAAVPLPARSTVLLDGGSLGQLLGHLVLQAGHPDQKPLLVDGLLQSLDVGLHLLLHALSEAAQVAASCSEPQGNRIQWPILQQEG